MTDELATEVLENVKRRMQGMWARVYKVRAWVNTGKEQVYQYGDVFLTESAARREFKIQASVVEGWKSWPNTRSGRVMLFIPHVFDDGSLATWPDDENYIDQFEFSNG